MIRLYPEQPYTAADALSVGYRLIDTAQAYANEKGVGDGIRRSDVSRSDIFMVDKIWMSHYDYDAAKASIDRFIAALTLYSALFYFSLPYSSSLTGSSHSFDSFSPGTAKARWANQLSDAAPCQCFTLAGIWITVPGRISTAGLPSS